jgi:hypothetical protein
MDKIIVNILPLETHNITDVIKGFLDISGEYPALYNYREIIVNEKNHIRLLVDTTRTEKLIKGHKYKIHFQKYYLKNMYIVTCLDLA